MILPLIFNTRNFRYYPVVKAIDSDEMVSVRICQSFYYEFEIDKETSVNGVNIKLDGFGSNDELIISIYDNASDQLIMQKSYQNPNVEAYWYNMFEFDMVELLSGNYTLILTSLNDAIRLLVNYDNQPYIEIVNEAEKFIRIKDLRYIKVNNFN